MNANVIADNWTRRLAAAIAGTLREIGARFRATPIIRFAVDCHPWNGLIALAILTAEEANADNLLLHPVEMAAWRYYNFSAELDSWRPAVQLGHEMRAAYEAADNHKAAADAFFRACAVAVASAVVAAALTELPCDPRFRVSVTHPDDGREFCP